MSLSLSNVFDASFYSAANPDLAKAGLTTDAQLLSHFQAYGLNEHRQFSPLVDLSFYRASYSDLANFTDSQLLNHLENYGVAEGRIFSPLFDLDYYRANNSDLASLNKEQLFNHLESYGVAEGREFSRIFNADYYKSHNPDLSAAKLNDTQLLDHFELYGIKEGRDSHVGYKVNSGNIQYSFSPDSSTDLTYHGGKTISNFNFFNFYFNGSQTNGSQSWSGTDINNINQNLSDAMSDPRLNSVISQYFPGQQVTSNFLGSTTVPGFLPNPNVTKDDIENYLKTAIPGYLKGYNFSSTVFNFMLPKGTTITLGGYDSKHGLGGYHGSVNYQGSDGKTNTAYYTVEVYSDETQGVAPSNQPWQNVVATAYHELNEARTDPDGEEYIRTGNSKWLGWFLNKEGATEVGDYPVTETDVFSLSHTAFWYEPLVNGQGTVPIQLLYSNAVHGPEDPTTIKFS